ncbi:MAG: rRNA pseudouridine synthase [Proteobacteria bacterium]|nr:rRNA pseudouridine synthase [Pseudomonadota bacterium]MBU1714175.1 rRNA pseudouridine synthase [Pseudomonadota bacterium]
MQERLQKIIAQAGICSRRKAEEFIRQGKIKVDGKIVTDMGIMVDSKLQLIEFEGQPLQSPEENVYILLNKPKGYVTTMHDPQGRPIVSSLLNNITARVFPVGRLDLDTEGALLLTNDGKTADRILHPRFEINKTYIAKVTGHPSQKKLLLLEKGVEIEGRMTSPAQLRVISTKAGSSEIEITIHEGRKRQVRKMFDAIGHRVKELKRVAYGGLKLGKLPLGKYRFLTIKDIDRIFI